MPAAILVLVLHGAVIGVAMFSRTAVGIRAKPGLVAFDVPPGEPYPRPSHPDHPRVAATQAEVSMPLPVPQMTRVDVMQILPDALPVSDAAAPAMPAAIGGGCDLTPQVQDALRHSDEIAGRLPAIPAARRSIANAIVVWNAGWIDAGAGPAQAALAAIRQTIEQAVAASSADCRGQLQAGPRLIYLPGRSGETTVLALGSGQWRWQQLLPGAVPPVTDIAQAAMAPAAPVPAGVASAGSPSQTPGQTPVLQALLASLIGKRSPATAPYYP